MRGSSHLPDARCIHQSNFHLWSSQFDAVFGLKSGRAKLLKQSSPLFHLVLQPKLLAVDGDTDKFFPSLHPPAVRSKRQGGLCSFGQFVPFLHFPFKWN